MTHSNHLFCFADHHSQREELNQKETRSQIGPAQSATVNSSASYDAKITFSMSEICLTCVLTIFHQLSGLKLKNCPSYDLKVIYHDYFSSFNQSLFCRFVTIHSRKIGKCCLELIMILKKFFFSNYPYSLFSVNYNVQINEVILVNIKSSTYSRLTIWLIYQDMSYNDVAFYLFYSSPFFPFSKLTTSGHKSLPHSFPTLPLG